ncbi:MAG TPA: IS1595 family transposase [Bryobacteraceae bacterium]|nr:IS1595 family transposase [Bryobacteraceae bacterium]
MEGDPKTLQEAIQYFSNPENCMNYVVARRWPNGVICPTCGRSDVRFISTRRMWECKGEHAKKQFSVKIGTIFEDSPLPLDKWLCAMWLLVSCKNGISSYEIHRDLGISQKSAWHMTHRVRLAVHQGTIAKASGHVEADETFIGGKARNMHASKRARRITGTGGKDKTAVMGILERSADGKPSKIRALTVIPNRRKKAIQDEVRKHVEAGTALYSDALASYNGLEREYAHQIIDHAVKYAEGNVHTNGLENFWALQKRSISGTYVSVEPFHLFRYLDEQAFRFNNRQDMTDSDRFDLAVRQIVGKRLTWAEVTGKVMDHQS